MVPTEVVMEASQDCRLSPKMNKQQYPTSPTEGSNKTLN